MLDIPDPDTVSRILTLASDGEPELYVFLLFVATLGLSPSEILGLDKTDIKNKQVYIRSAVVPNEFNKYIKKNSTKAYDRTRVMDIPSVLSSALNKLSSKDNKSLLTKGYSYFYKRYKKILVTLVLPNYRLYDLRHANASIMLMLGVQDKYAMERMGHSTSNMLKAVYQHTYKSEQDKHSQIIDDFFKEEIDGK